MSVEKITECMICTEKFGENRLPAVGSCDHNGICSVCFLRMRALGKDLTCPMCKVKLEQIWNENLSPGDNTYDHQSAMFFPTKYYRKKVEPLWVRTCSMCPESNRDIKQLRAHLQSQHNLHMCLLCVENKQSFPSEQKIYNQLSYEQHLRGADNKDGNEGHPNCEFCHKRFYDKYGLFMHLQKEHFTCHICEKRGILYQYFHHYSALQNHFKYGHYACEDPQCLEAKYVVFADEFSLIAHHQQHHQHPQSRKNLVYPHHNRDRDGRERGGRGQDPRSVRYDAGLGGKATRDGMWQIILEEAAVVRDPRAADRERLHGDPRRSSEDRDRDRDTEAAAAATAAVVPPAPEDFPGLPPSSASVGAGGGSSRGFGFAGSLAGGGLRRGASADDFPTLGGASASAAVAIGRSASAGPAQDQQEPTMLFGKAVKKSKKLFVYKPEKGAKSSSSSSSSGHGAASITSFMAAVAPPMSAAVAAHNGLPIPTADQMLTLATKEERQAALAKLMSQSKGSAAAPNPEPAPESKPKAPKAKAAPQKPAGPSIVQSIAASRPVVPTAPAGGGISIMRVKSPGISVAATSSVSSASVSLVPAARYTGAQAGDFPGLPEPSAVPPPPPNYRTLVPKSDLGSSSSSSSSGKGGAGGGASKGGGNTGPGGNTWTCSVCTLVNACSRTTCLACDSLRVFGGKATKPATSPTSPSKPNTAAAPEPAPIQSSIDFDMDFPPPPPSLVTRVGATGAAGLGKGKGTTGAGKIQPVSINGQSKRVPAFGMGIGLGAGGSVAGAFAGGSSKPGGNPKPNKWDKPPI